MSATETQRTIAAVWRIESARLIGSLARQVRDVGLAEELAQDALVAAMEQWPQSGVPDNPGAWLMTTARRRAIDALRRDALLARKHVELAHELESAFDDAHAMADAALDDPIGDDVLRLVFTACHPVLPFDARIALTLRMLGGLTTEEIARAYLVPEATVAQRIVRAKRSLSDAQVPFEVPRGAELAERLDAVLEVIYLIFNEGYTATAGGDWMRPQLCEEAQRLARIVCGLMPREAEVQGLAALLELQASRAPARTAADGTPILLADQNRARWDRLLIQRGLAALERAHTLGGRRGRYTLQAAIAACHARAPSAAATDWREIAALYGELGEVAPSPIVELNRAVAVGMADGAAAGLAVVDELREEPALRQYHLLYTVRADLLERLGRHAEAEREYRHAAGLTRNERERVLLDAHAERTAAAARA